MTEPTLLETRYRTVLRLLPPAYRAAWEDDMVGALLDSRGVDGSGSEDDVVAGLGRPGPGEVASVLSLAVRARLGVFGATPRQALWSEAVRRFALVGLMLAAADVVAGVVVSLVQGYRPFAGSPLLPGVLADEPVRSLLGLAALGWPAAFLALILRRPRLAGVLAVAALTPELVAVVEEVRTFGNGATSVVWQAVRVLPVLALLAWHGAAPPARRRAWSAAVLVTACIQLVVTAPWYLGGDAFPPGPPDWFSLVLLDLAGIQAVAIAVAAALHLVARRHGARSARPAGP